MPLASFLDFVDSLPRTIRIHPSTSPQPHLTQSPPSKRRKTKPIILTHLPPPKESAWASIWTRPGLDLKSRSILNLGMLTALGKWTELGIHIRGAIRNGCPKVEIQECY